MFQELPDDTGTPASDVSSAIETAETKSDGTPDAIDYFHVEREHLDGRLVPKIVPNDEHISKQWKDLECSDGLKYGGRPIVPGAVVTIWNRKSHSPVRILDVRETGVDEKHVILIAWYAAETAFGREKDGKAKRSRQKDGRQQRGKRRGSKAEATHILSNSMAVFPHDVISGFPIEGEFASRDDKTILDTFADPVVRRKTGHHNVVWLAAMIRAASRTPAQVNLMSADGESVDAAGESVDAAGESVDAAGESVDAEGESVDAEGESVDAE